MPPTKNRSAGSWRATARDKKAYWRVLDTFWLLAVQRQEIVPPTSTWQACWASAACYPRGVRDQDNLMALMKPLQDWIVGKGIVHDDNPYRWQWRAIPGQVAQRKHPAWMVLTLEACEPHEAYAPRHTTRKAA